MDNQNQSFGFAKSIDVFCKIFIFPLYYKPTIPVKAYMLGFLLLNHSPKFDDWLGSLYPRCEKAPWGT